MDQLQDYQRRYRQLTEQVGALGFVSEGTLVHRYTTCGKPTCRCQTDPDHRHGPYWQWTRKVDGKTVTRRLSPAEATLYEEWITNGRRLEELIREMRNLSREAGEILLRDVRDT
jgi:hypothetical protein